MTAYPPPAVPLLADDDAAAVRRAAGPATAFCVFAEVEELFRVKLTEAGLACFVTSRAGTSLEVAAEGRRFHVARPGTGSSVIRRLTRQLGDGHPGGPPDGPPDGAAGGPDRGPETGRAPEPDGIGGMIPERQRRRLIDVVRETADAVATAGAAPEIEADLARHVISVADGTRGVRADDRWRVELRAGARAGGQAPKALRIVSAVSVADLAARGDHLRAAGQAAKAAVSRREAVPAPAGEMPVVLGPGSPASLFHEVCGHGLEGDIACGPGGAYGPLIGRPVASPSLTIADDPRVPAHAPLYTMDDEGEAARETTLVDRGVVTAVLADRATGRLLRRPPTGNGRRVGYQHPALTRMSCTYIKAGDVGAEAALEGVRRGLYIAGITSGETTMSGESFRARVSEAYLIENGSLTRAVAPGAMLSGRGLDLLGAVDVVCDDLSFVPYGFQCNKLGQYPLTVSVGQPTLRLRRLAVRP